jgi:aminoglycoside 3-N-acetyltransferase I
MDIYTKRLSAHDLLKMRALNNLFGDVFEDPASYHSDPPTDEYLAKFLSDDSSIVLVAKENDNVIGGLVAYTLNKFEKQRKEVYLYDLAVSNQYQRRGIGRKLIEELKAVAKQANAYVVFVQADEGDEAVKFYESLNPDENIKTRNFDFNI